MDRTYLNPSHLLYIPQNYLNAKCSPFICISSICLTWAAGFFFLKVQSVISMSPPPPGGLWNPILLRESALFKLSGGEKMTRC